MAEAEIGVILEVAMNQVFLLKYSMQHRTIWRLDMRIIVVLFMFISSVVYAGSREPPPESKMACKGKPEGEKCSFVSPKGEESGSCEYTPDKAYFSCRPDRDARKTQKGNIRENDSRPGPKELYSIEQSTDDNTQLKTISFAALAFMSSDICDMSFLPPGKSASYFGFQHLRDVFGGAEGHGQNFVPRIANNLLYILNRSQKNKLIHLAEKQLKKINQFAMMRFPLLITFDRFAHKQLPNGTLQLNRQKIIQHSADLYALDGELSYERAIGFAEVIHSLSKNQKEKLEGLKNKKLDNWTTHSEQLDKRSFDHDVYIALMTYSSELYSWYAGDLEKDVYFTPERTAAYFGAYWTKAAPMKAVKTKNYKISMNLTSESGVLFLEMLSSKQRKKITGLVQAQKRYLLSLTNIRRGIAVEIRKIFTGTTGNYVEVIRLSRKFGEADGEIAYLYANAFTEVRHSLTRNQQKKAIEIRNISQYKCKGAFLYAEPISVPDVSNISTYFK